MPIIKLPVIPDSAVISVEISGFFYKKIQATLLALGTTKSPEEFKNVLKKLETDNPPEDLYEIQVHLFTALVAAIEKSAKEQNKIETIDFDTDKNQDI